MPPFASLAGQRQNRSTGGVASKRQSDISGTTWPTPFPGPHSVINYSTRDEFPGFHMWPAGRDSHFVALGQCHHQRDEGLAQPAVRRLKSYGTPNNLILCFSILCFACFISEVCDEVVLQRGATSVLGSRQHIADGDGVSTVTRA